VLTIIASVVLVLLHGQIKSFSQITELTDDVLCGACCWFSNRDAQGVKFGGFWMPDVVCWILEPDYKDLKKPVNSYFVGASLKAQKCPRCATYI
jgi:hypothetical protein